MTSDQPLFLSNRKLDGVHGLRGVAAFAVVLFHAQVVLRDLVPGFLAKGLNLLYLSVLLFFALSAFTLSHSHRVAPTTYAGYLAKRFFRIAPLFYLMALFACYLQGKVPDLAVLLANLTFTFNLFPGLEESLAAAGWSVGVEMLFYLVFPALLPLLRRPVQMVAGYSVAILASIASWHFLRDAPSNFPPYAYYFIGSNLAVFVAGVIAYRLYETTTPRDHLRLALPAAVAFVGVFVVGDPLNLHGRFPGLYFSSWGLGFALCCLWQAWYPSKILASQFFHWIGDRSYSIYLIHPWVVYFYSRDYLKPIESASGLSGSGLLLLSLAIIAAATATGAAVSFRYIELPAMRLGSRLAKARDLLPSQQKI